MSPTITQTQKDTWLAALRSGEIPQIRGQMRDGTGLGRCCLGVLDDQTTSRPVPVPDYENVQLLLGDKIADECVIRNDGRVSESEPQSFLQIADWLETALVVVE